MKIRIALCGSSLLVALSLLLPAASCASNSPSQHHSAAQNLKPEAKASQDVAPKDELPRRPRGIKSSFQLDECKVVIHVSCMRQCLPEGFCCNDKPTPKGWTACQDMCTQPPELCK
jgi:hypothetical protein